MHAAVVNAWGSPPKYQTYDLPPPGPNELRIKVLAAGFHNLVRSRAAGKHYSTAKTSPPHIPGTDGVGKIVSTGQLVYFSSFTTPTGSFAEEINVGQKDVTPLPENADPDQIAAMLNPAMSSWMALTARAGIAPGSDFKVAIIGATGVSGQTAVQISRAMGASTVIAIGRKGPKLEKTKELGADSTIALTEKLEEVDFEEAADVDVVLDYLWGETAKTAVPAILSKRKNKSQRLTWVEIGALAGDANPVSAALLRSSNLVVCGCGPGSWTWPEMGKKMPALLKAIVDGGIRQDVVVKKLEEVEEAWGQTGERMLFKP